VNGVGHFGQPFDVPRELQHIQRREVFNAAPWWVTERQKKPLGDKLRHVMRLDVQHPGGLLHVESCRPVVEESEELSLIVTHIVSFGFCRAHDPASFYACSSPKLWAKANRVFAKIFHSLRWLDLPLPKEIPRLLFGRRMEALIQALEEYRAATHLDLKLSAGDTMARLLYPKLHRFLSAKCPAHAVDDLAQETLLAITRSLPRLKGTREFPDWCLRIARRRLADYYKKNPRVTEELDEEALWTIVEASGRTTPLSAADCAALKEALSMVAKADEPCAEYLKSIYLNGWTFAELGAKMGKTKDAARVKLNRCLELAGALVQEKGLAHV